MTKKQTIRRAQLLLKRPRLTVLERAELRRLDEIAARPSLVARILKWLGILSVVFIVGCRVAKDWPKWR